MLFHFPFIAKAQSIDELSNYLKNNSFSFDVSNETSDSNIVHSMFQKKLFVMGENHTSKYNNGVRLKIIASLNERQQFKKFFIELGRSAAYINNMYLNDSFVLNQPLYYYHSAVGSWWWEQKQLLEKIKSNYKKRYDFYYAGIDFERDFNFYIAINNLFYGKSYSFSTTNQKYIQSLLDSAYLNQNEKKFLSFYKEAQIMFSSLSSTLSNELNEHDYAVLKYLLGNENTSKNLNKREKEFARNILNEIDFKNDTDSYFLNIGLAHSIKSDKGNFIDILLNDKRLIDKVVVMNMYNDGPGFDDIKVLKFMNDNNVLQSFRNEAKNKGKLVLFDLSKLPDSFSDIRKCCDWLLFVNTETK